MRSLWLSKWLPALLLFVAGLQGIKKLFFLKLISHNLVDGGSNRPSSS